MANGCFSLLQAYAIGLLSTTTARLCDYFLSFASGKLKLADTLTRVCKIYVKT